MKIEENKVYTTKEVAELLRVSMPTIKRMLKDGRLPSTRIGRQHRFLGKDLLDILTNREDLRKDAVPAPIAQAPVAQPAPAPQQTYSQQPPSAIPTAQQQQAQPPAPAQPQPQTRLAPPPQRTSMTPAPPQLNAIEARQRIYMLGRTVQRDVLGDDGDILFRAGIEVTDAIILEAKKTRKMMDLFSSLRSEE